MSLPDVFEAEMWSSMLGYQSINFPPLTYDANNALSIPLIWFIFSQMYLADLSTTHIMHSISRRAGPSIHKHTCLTAERSSLMYHLSSSLYTTPTQLALYQEIWQQGQRPSKPHIHCGYVSTPKLQRHNPQTHPPPIPTISSIHNLPSPPPTPFPPPHHPLNPPTQPLNLIPLSHPQPNHPAPLPAIQNSPTPVTAR